VEDSGRERKSMLSELSQDVLRAAMVDIVSKALSLLALAIAGLVVLFVLQGGSLPAWICVLEFGLILVLIVLARRRGQRSASLIAREAEVAALQQEAELYGYALDRHQIYSDHVAQVLDHLQRVVSGDIDSPIPDYIQRGILEPARDVLNLGDPSQEARLSILLPDDNDFVMAWAAGHSFGSAEKYRVPRNKTLARLALETGALHAWDDVTEDDRFEQNPHANRSLHAMVSVPLLRGDQVIGVLNAIASKPGVFDPAEESYLLSLGGVLSVAVNVWLEQSEPDAVA
jgi:GAF domain-containing protein